MPNILQPDQLWPHVSSSGSHAQDNTINILEEEEMPASLQSTTERGVTWCGQNISLHISPTSLRKLSIILGQSGVPFICLSWVLSSEGGGNDHEHTHYFRAHV